MGGKVPLGADVDSLLCVNRSLSLSLAHVCWWSVERAALGSVHRRPTTDGYAGSSGRRGRALVGWWQGRPSLLFPLHHTHLDWISGCVHLKLSLPPSSSSLIGQLNFQINIFVAMVGEGCSRAEGVALPLNKQAWLVSVQRLQN